MARYFLFIDDSGTKEYASAGEQYGRTGKSRFFVFGGVLLAEDVAAQLAQRIADLKRGAFGRPDVELKSNWLRIPKERSARYLDRFSISSGTLDSLVEQVYDAVVDTDLQLLAAVVDKAHMQERYGTHAWYAPAVAYDCLLQRVALEVRPPHGVRVFIDDMSGATPKGNQYRDNLRSHHAQLCATGSRLQRDVRFDGIEPGLRFVNSARSHLIQVADIVSYNVNRQFVDFPDAWEARGQSVLPTYPWFLRLAAKFRTDGLGRIQGYGVVKFPLKTRVRWGVNER